MSRKKSLIHMIAACEKIDFDKIVKAYLKEIYSYKHIVQTDGKDDCGLDIKVFDFSDQKIQYHWICRSPLSGFFSPLSLPGSFHCHG